MEPNTTPRRNRGRRPLHRTVLSLAVAAVIGASIPFSAMYVKAVQTPPAAVATLPTATAGHPSVKIVTTASGRKVTVPVTGSSSPSAVVTPVSTRSSD